MLAGGIETDEALAGGELKPFEDQMMWRFGCQDRSELNAFFGSEKGQEILAEAYRSGSYRLRLPEEAWLMLDPPKAEFGPLRFYPELLSFAPPDPSQGWRTFRLSVGQLRELLAAYESPLELRRMGESLRVWRPHYEELLALVAETYEEGWPFQAYPEGWSDRVESALLELEEKVFADPACGYPQRTGSNLRQLMSILAQAAQSPEELSGREVGLVRTIVAHSVERWGTLGSSERAQALEAREQALPAQGNSRMVQTLLERLEPLDSEGGLEEPESILGPVEDEPVSEALRDRLLRSRLGTLEQLIQWGLVGSLDALAELVPRLTAQVLFHGESDPALGRLLQRSYLAYRGLRTWRQRPAFEELPWLARLMQQPNSGRAEQALALARELVEVSWGHYPQFEWPPLMGQELKTLARWAGLTELTDFEPASWQAVEPEFNPAQAARLCAQWIDDESSRTPTRVYARQRQARALEKARDRLTFFIAQG